MAERRTTRGGLSHLDSRGRARMVDTSLKPVSERRAVAEASVRLSPATVRLVLAGKAGKTLSQRVRERARPVGLD